MPKISIITINFNNAAGLKRTIESVVNQTTKDFDYIIIDGGSSDGSVEVIRSFTDIPSGVFFDIRESDAEDNTIGTPKRCKDAREQSVPIVYWISEPDSGIYNAMNKGIRIAKGEYLQFLNSGDTLVSNDVTERMLADMPETSILIGNMLKLLPDGKIFRDKGTGIEQPTFLTFYRGTLNHSPAYINRSLFEKFGLYDESLKIVADWKWYLIAVALNNESVIYKDIDVTLFNMSGISNKQINIERIERRRELEKLIPVKILKDYDTYWRSIDMFRRINRHFLSRKIVWLIERILFRIERWKII
jgi:glycosyltransferase involved in cell wall biosynthesis